MRGSLVENDQDAEVARIVEEMEETGASAETIEAFLEAQAAIDDVHADDEPPFSIWPENHLPLRVLQLCHFERVVGMAGSQITGVTTAEINAVMDALQIPGPDRAELLADVRYAAGIAVPEINSER